MGCKSATTPTDLDQLNLDFNPAYSGFDGVHTYKIPTQIRDSGFTTLAVTWTASDPSMVDLTPSADTKSVMVTTKKPGTVKIIATTDTAQGKTTLTIKQYTPDQWTAGMTRYTAGTPTDLRKQFRDLGGDEKFVQCTSCHGNTMANSPGIEHTPEQTGGFTDDEMKGIILSGKLPASQIELPFLDAANFMNFHTWQAADSEIDGLVAYLRSLEPKDQGPFNFGGRRPDGGWPRMDQGMPNMSDMMGTTDDAGKGHHQKDM